MEQPTNKASFIPKRMPSGVPGGEKDDGNGTQAPKDKKPLDLLLLVGVVIFIGAVLVAIGMFVYEYKVRNDIHTASIKLDEVSQDIDQDFVAHLEDLDTRITDAEDILKKHDALTKFFNALEKQTLKNIQFTGFNYSRKDDSYHVSMQGLAKDYQTVALQSSVFAEAGVIKYPHFDNLGKDASTGFIRFQIDANVNPDLFKYGEGISSEATSSEK